MNFDFHPEYKGYSSEESVKELLAPARKHEKHTEKPTEVPDAKYEIPKESRYKRPEKNPEEPVQLPEPTLIEESVYSSSDSEV